MDYNNEPCRIAAQMLETEPALLDYRLIDYINEINIMSGGCLKSKEVIAFIIVQWRFGKADDFTGEPKT